MSGLSCVNHHKPMKIFLYCYFDLQAFCIYVCISILYCKQTNFFVFQKISLYCLSSTGEMVLGILGKEGSCCASFLRSDKNQGVLSCSWHTWLSGIPLPRFIILMPSISRLVFAYSLFFVRMIKLRTQGRWH